MKHAQSPILEVFKNTGKEGKSNASIRETQVLSIILEIKIHNTHKKRTTLDHKAT